MEKESITILRKMKSVCPKCLKMIDARIVERKGKIYMTKKCQQDGPFEVFLSHHPWYYKGLNDFYFSLMNKSLGQKDYIVHLTNRCNLDCPICLADANMRGVEDYPLENLREFLKGKKNYKIDLMGTEPTMRDDLLEIIRAVHKSGNINALHTNGIKLTDFNYLKGLKRAGLGEVHFQLDGFDDRVDKKLRGKRLVAIKRQALENLERLGLGTDLVATIVRGLNEKEMINVLNYGIEKPFVKEIFFLGCRFLGKARDLPFADCLMPDELIDILEKQSKGRISRKSIYNFQKLYFALLSIFSVRKCYYIHHYLLVRQKGGYLPIGEVIDLEAMQKSLDRYKDMRLVNSRWALPYLFFSLLPKFLNFRALLLVKDFLILKLLFIFGFALSRFPGRLLLLGFISACDAYTLDYQIAQNCGKGAISTELGIQDTGAIDNVMRQRNFILK